MSPEHWIRPWRPSSVGLAEPNTLAYSPSIQRDIAKLPRSVTPVTAIPLRALLGDLDAMDFKLHCAVWNGEVQPIDALARSWDEWVTWSRWRPSNDVFNRQLIFSMARDRTVPTRWLFGGVFEVVGRRNEPNTHAYDLKVREDILGPYIKRLWLNFKPPGRAIRLNFDKHVD